MRCTTPERGLISIGADIRNRGVTSKIDLGDAELRQVCAPIGAEDVRPPTEGKSCAINSVFSVLP